MADFQFQFSTSSFNELFPFYILIDSDLIIKRCGASLLKMMPNLVEEVSFTSVFSIKRPFTERLDANILDLLLTQFVLIEALNLNDTVFKGQIQKHNDCFLFVGSPWFVSMEEIVNKKLIINDFAAHDSLIDLLHVFKTQEIANEDLKQLIIKIKKQKTILSQDKEKINQLSLVASANENGIVLTDLEGKIFWSNEAYLALTGYNTNDVIDQTVSKLGVSEFLDSSILNNILHSFKSGEKFDCQIKHKKKNNDWFWARIKGQPVLDLNGKFVQYFVIIDDITKVKEVNDRLKESENRLSSLILNLQNGILLEDEDRRILLVNKEFCNMFGLNINPDVMIGMDCTNSAEESKAFFSNSNHFVERINEILFHKEIVIGEELKLIDGRIFERSYIPIEIDGIYKGHLWTYTDVTLKKNYSEGLSYEKEKYRRIIDNVNIGLIEVDTDENILMANNRFSEMSGYSTEYLIGKKSTELFLDADNKKILENKLETRKLGNTDSYELMIKNKNGELKQWLISGAPNYNIKGEFIGTIGLHFDITETKYLEIQREQLLKKLEKQNEQLNEFANMVSNDLKSPLKSINSLIKFIQEDNDNKFNEKTAKYFTLIQEKVEKTEDLIQGILSYSKLETEALLKEKIDINNLVNHINSILFIPSNIKVLITNKLPIIYGDKFRIQQLFQNLISNAINYNDKPSGLITISFEEFDDYYVFSINDNGMGILKKNQKKIFEMFQSFNTGEKSTGIGLTIVRKIIDNLNEKIWFESKENVGSKFSFTIHKYDMNEIPNLEYINRLADGNNAIIKRLVKILKQELQIEIENYKENILISNYSKAADSVHKIRYKIGLVGLAKNYSESEIYEKNLRNNLNKYQNKFNRTITKLEEFLKNI